MTQRPDVLGAPYRAEEIHLPDDAEGPVVATLVHRPAAEPTRRAVLHVHGFADYFFQTGYAEWWTARGYDFYALDLRKYGRSIRPHQTPNYVADLAEYFVELDAAWDLVTGRDGHDHVVLTGHSTGGLTTPLWADARRPPELRGMVLNSPWFDLQGSPLLRTVGTVLVDQIGRRTPMRVLPRSVSGLYARSLHRDHEGEWDFDLTWKPLESFTVHAGWLRAVRRGHARLHAGLEVPCPVLVLSSDASSRPAEMGDDVHRHDIVLEVPHIRRWAGAVGPHVTYVAVPGARHDVVLSLPAPRAAAYDAIGRWHDAWVS
ncbi:alpha/beta hydrolase [Nocardioides marmotae]|uniref:Alpha/beta fold hydrolase n=1 Tax=Nocardioides marmotae TaxID=2663857 RepID=A0A6I3J5M4_9ACTN|nr:alpha/beta hydrolase [Nocardioides marmotae]MCR6030967.1 alpha/beta fold hydrolase [Gordonia jinghuaiqii]MBC9731680.1 alpha/beta hydrolase [Nocardioides marmotae]MTB82802.1 alpha/beta fold hydrolase [Nocardioides marmotae]MTB94604.1 alpha/beta fold hydrolase [Nocardioides marmotae]QKE01386.1 alpha/beta hydrolase [Nocardioides marmotae]